MDRKWLRCLEIAIGAVLLASGICHIANPYAFFESVVAYKLLSGTAAVCFAMLIPCLQLVAAAGLLFDFKSVGAMWLSVATLLLFVIAQISAWVRGLHIDCGCFGPIRSMVSLWTIMMVSILFAAAVLGAIWQGRELSTRSLSRVVRQGLSSGRRRGISLVEVVCVIAIIGILISMLMPAVQSAREAARNAGCYSHLRQIALAAHQFEAAHQRLPPGTLGFATLIEFPYQGAAPLEWGNPASPLFWQRAQHTSSLLVILPFIEEDAIYRQLPLIAVSASKLYGDIITKHPIPWIGIMDGMDAAKSAHVGIFYCPSDNLAHNRNLELLAIVTTQPSFARDTMLDGFSAEPWLDTLEPIAGTNYLASAGAHSGGDQPNAQLKPYRGLMTSRRQLPLGRAPDGTSRTILYGENIGLIESRRRYMYHSWVFGGLIRGRGILPWGELILPEAPQHLLLGDSQFAYIAGFGSMHPSSVNVAMADGSVQGVSRMVQLSTFYALCGAFDGDVTTE